MNNAVIFRLVYSKLHHMETIFENDSWNRGGAFNTCHLDGSIIQPLASCCKASAETQGFYYQLSLVDCNRTYRCNGMCHQRQIVGWHHERVFSPLVRAAQCVKTRINVYHPRIVFMIFKNTSSTRLKGSHFVSSYSSRRYTKCAGKQNTLVNFTPREESSSNRHNTGSRENQEH